MKKSILKLLLIITIISLILMLFAGCKSPDTSELEERIEKLELEDKIEELEEELAKKEAEEAAPEEEKVTEDTTDTEQMEEEEEGEEETVDADSDTDDDGDSDTGIDKEAPTISLAIYEGPTLDGSICYYRVEATVTGSPTVSFSKDDSSGAWGSKKVQININNPAGTYTLTATATNSEGSTTDSITLDWGCAIPPIVKDVNIGADASLSGEIIMDSFVEQGADPVSVGDSVFNNKAVKTYLSFDIDDLGDIDGINIKDVSISMPIDAIIGNPEMVEGFEVDIKVVYYGGSLELADQNLGSYKVDTITAENPLAEFYFSSNKLEDQLQKAVDVDKEWFQVKIETSGVLANGDWDYYRIPIGGVVLYVTYEMPG